MTTIEFIDAIRGAHGVSSDNAVAQLLGLSRQQVSFYRSGRQFLGDETALVVAELLDIPPAYVVACAQAERARDAEVRSFWLDLARISAPAKALRQVLHTGAKTAAVIGATALLMGQPDRAYAAQKGADNVTSCILCQLALLRRFARRLAGFFDARHCTALPA